jgi:hypothetical protein
MATTNNAAYDLRLNNIKNGMPASGQYTGPASLGSPSDRGPNPAVPMGKKVSALARKKSLTYNT